jgi:cellulose synthase/poly-beta-1,6-N-acetylglucosamine synthase-like glycosyltransferase
MTLLWYVVLVPGLVLGTFVGYELLFALLSIPWLLARARPAVVDNPTPTMRFVVLVPAHDEELLISQTVRSLVGVDYPRELREVYVIADNCTDETAALARAAGARCEERRDLTHRGKPHALRWMVERLGDDPYDALVVIDADTVVRPDFLRAIEARLREGARSVQTYFGVLNADENWLTRLGVVPSSLKYRLHYPGKALVGLSCPLAGNGMVFRRDVLQPLGWTAFSLTENWEYWAQLALRGIIVEPANDAVLYAQAARSLALGGTQRMRWMKGRIGTLTGYWRRLAAQALRGNMVALDALIELARPSHSMLVFWSVIYMMLTCALAVLGMPGATSLAIFGVVIVGVQAALFMIGLALERPPLRTWLALGMAPWYLLWKFAISLKGISTMRDRTWTKTTRH